MRQSASRLSMHTYRQPGFTIVELLIVIVVIAILAAIVIVAYNGITDKARTDVLKSDLSGGWNTLGISKVDIGTYPTDQASAGLKSSDGDTLAYVALGDGYCLQATGWNQSYYVTDANSQPTNGNCPVYASDDFNRPNSTSLGSTQFGSYAWQSSTPGQIWGIIGNKLATSKVVGVSHTPIVYVDAGQQNGVAQVTVSSIQDDCAGIVLRYNTSAKTALAFAGCGDVPGWYSNYTFINVSTNDVTGGESLAAPSVAKTAADGDTIKVIANGNTFTGYVNGTQIQQYTTSSYSGTNIGLYDDNVVNWYSDQSVNTSVSYDNFSWVPLP